MVHHCKIDKNALAKKLRSLVSPQKHDELNSHLRKIPPSGELKGKAGSELLHFAAKHNNVELLRYLVDSLGLDVDAKNSYGTTPVVTAALYDHLEAVRWLLEANASVWITNSAGRTALQVVTDKRRRVSRRVVDLFLERLTIRGDDQLTPMLEKLGYPMDLVARANDAELTRAMLRRREPLSERHCRLLVERSVQSGSLENLEVLLNCGSGRDCRKEMFVDALKAALNEGSSEELGKFERILRRLDRLEVVDENLAKAFRDVYREGGMGVVRVLVECQIHRFVRDLLPRVFTNPNVDVSELPLGDEFDANARGESGSTALHLAAKCAFEKNVLFLLERGADANVKDDEGRAPLHVTDSEKCVEHLLRFGADIEAVINSGTAYRKLVRFECVLAGLAVMDAQQIPIGWRIRDAVGSMGFYGECRAQIGWLRTRTVGKNVTLFSVLVEDTERMADYVRSREVVGEFLRTCGKRGLNRYYVEMLTRNLNGAVKVNEIKSRAVDAVCRCTMPLLGSNRALIEKIVGFLSYGELRVLASVRKEIS